MCVYYAYTYVMILYIHYIYFLYIYIYECLLLGFFGIILDLQKICKDNTEISHIPLTQLLLMLTSKITMVHLSKLKN